MGLFSAFRRTGLLAVSLFAVSCGGEVVPGPSAEGFLPPAEASRCDSLTEQLGVQMQAACWERVVEAGDGLQRIGDRFRDEETLLTAYAYKGAAFLAADRIDSADFYLRRGLALWNRLSLERPDAGRMQALYALFNSLGIYSINVGRDYPSAISYFLRGMELSEARGERVPYVTFCSNLVVTFYLRRDAGGLRYARQVYDYGVGAADEYARFAGAYTSALMYFLAEDYERAGLSIDEALSLVDRFYDRTGVCTVRANIYRAQGQRRLAEEWYGRALDCMEGEDAMSASYTCLCAGLFRAERGDARAAAALFRRGIAVAAEGGNTVFLYRLYEALSEVSVTLGEYRTALEYYTAYVGESGKLFDAEKEHTIRELQVRYDTARKERQIETGRLELEKQQRRLQAVVFGLVLSGSAAGAVLLLYRNRMRMYRQIVLRYQESVRREEQSRRRIALLEERISRCGDPPAGDASEERDTALFLKIDSLMRSGRLYREPNLTRERVAELAGTNRTYLSQAVNRQTGMTFGRYVNKLRIEEAVRLLSDPENDVPLKALVTDLGFVSLSTFYSLFRQEVGMTPLKYRETVFSLRRARRRG